jgi:hypothetical protein
VSICRIGTKGKSKLWQLLNILCKIRLTIIIHLEQLFFKYRCLVIGLLAKERLLNKETIQKNYHSLTEERQCRSHLQ